MKHDRYSSINPKIQVFALFCESKNLFRFQEFLQVLGIGSNSATIDFKGLLLYFQWNQFRSITFF